MSNETKIPNEDELWDVLNTPTETPAKKAAPKAAAPVEAPAEPEKKPAAPKEKPAEPEKKPAAPKEKPAEPEKKPAAPKEKPAKTGRKIDGFFIGCMAGVAAVSVAVTLLISSMGGGSAVPGASGGASGDVDALRKENAELKAQVELQQKTILDLQNNLMDFMGTEQFLENAATAPSGENDVLDKQTEAYEILVQIQNAYTSFDREKLEELIPQMDERLQYLNEDALNSYYLILEYMEQPSNG